MADIGTHATQATDALNSAGHAMASAILMFGAFFAIQWGFRVKERMHRERERLAVAVIRELPALLTIGAATGYLAMLAQDHRPNLAAIFGGFF